MSSSANCFERLDTVRGTYGSSSGVRVLSAVPSSKAHFDHREGLFELATAYSNSLYRCQSPARQRRTVCGDMTDRLTCRPGMRRPLQPAPSLLISEEGRGAGGGAPCGSSL